MKKKLGICILNYNGNKDTVECVQSIIRYGINDKTIFILDNASDNSDYELLVDGIKKLSVSVYCLEYEDFVKAEQFTEDIIIIRSKTNTGFSKGNNILLDKIIQLKYKYALLLNNDTIIIDDAINQSLKFMENRKGCGISTVNVCYFDNQNHSWSAGSRILFAGYRKYLSDKRINYYLNNGVNRIRVKFITGCYLMIRVQVLKKYGELNEDFFFGEEDFNYAMRMKNNRVTQMSLIDIKILHKVSSSINKYSSHQGNMMLYYVQRYIDMKKFYGMTKWNIWRMIYSTIVLILLKRRNIKKPGLMVRKINLLAIKNDKVNESLFKEIKNG